MCALTIFGHLKSTQGNEYVLLTASGNPASVDVAGETGSGRDRALAGVAEMQAQTAALQGTQHQRAGAANSGIRNHAFSSRVEAWFLIQLIKS